MRWGLVALCLLGACDDASQAVDGGPGGRDGPSDGSPPDAALADAPADVGQDRPAVLDAADVSGVPRAGPLDLLFVIDNSSSMREEQEMLGRAFPAFIEALRGAAGGLPDLRIAIVSTNFGAGPTVPSPECLPLGDRGRFQVRAGCGLDAGSSHFLAIDGRGSQNFTGELSQTFTCLATLGTGGCGYEHQLQAVRGALADSVNPENRGFRRDAAALGIIILSDEDDCSGEPDADFYGTPIPGQAGSLRCALLGHVCGGQAVPAMPFQTPLSQCQPYVRTQTERQTRLINVQEFVDFVSVVKAGRPDRILVSTVIGWSEDPTAMYGIDMRAAPAGGQELDLRPVCMSPNGIAFPGIRLRTFARAFQNHTVHSICTSDLSPAMREIAQKLAIMLN